MFRGKMRIRIYDAHSYAVYEHNKNSPAELCFIGSYGECKMYIASVRQSPIEFICRNLAIANG